MKYLLRKNVLDKVPEIPITEQEYNDLVMAKEILWKAFNIEEKYEMLISNYLSFEKCQTDTVAKQMIKNFNGYHDGFKTRLSLNTSLLNLLTTSRLYLDTIDSSAQKCAPKNSGIKEKVAELLNQEYDTKKEYRFIEALRNHSQHADLPLHFISYPSRWTSLEKDGLLEFSLNINSYQSTLRENKKFKRSALEGFDEKIDLKFAVRCYLESISSVHDSVRNIISESVDSSRQLIKNVHSRYGEFLDEQGEIIGLAAIVRDDIKQVSHAPLFLGWDDIRIDLQKQNTKLVNLHKRFISGSTNTSPLIK